MERIGLNTPKGPYFFVVIGLLWLLLLAVSYFGLSYEVDRNNYDLALHDARTNYEKDLIYRKWVALEGGVYVPITEYTPPNPYLKVPNKEIETKSGQKLTLVNPAYMTRMVHELEKDKYGAKGHITSLKPINPINNPDQWERSALELFEKGTKEYHSIEIINGVETFRYMAALIAEKPCLKCHERQGYKLGDVRGGISVAIPYDSFTQTSALHKKNELYLHFVLALLGMVVVFIYSKTSERHRIELELEQKKYSTILELSPEAIVVHSGGKFVYTNKSGIKIFNAKSEGDFIGKDVLSFVHPQSIPAAKERISKMLQEGVNVPPLVEKIICVDGTEKEMEISAAPIIFEKNPSIILVARDVSELQKAYRDIKNSQEKLNALIQALPDLVFEMDKKGIFLDSHFPSEENLYAAPIDFIGKNVIDVLPPEIAKVILASLEKLFTTGEQQIFNYSLQVHNQSKFFEARFILKGETEALAVVRDITRRKHSETELRKLSSAVVQSPISIVITDLEGTIEYVNPKFTEVTGYTLGEVINKNPRILKSGEQNIEFYQNLWKTILSGKSWHGEFHNKRKNGELYWEDALISPIKDDDGNITNIVAIKEDITEVKNAAEALIKSEQKFNFYLNNSPLATIEWNENFIITRWTGEAEKIFGYKAIETIGLDLEKLNFVYHEDLPAVHEVMKKMVSGTTVYEISTNRNVTKDGKIINCIWYNSVLRNEKGEMISALSQVMDITDRVRAEKELNEQMVEINRFNKAMIGREEKMILLKAEVNSLLKEAGKAIKYNISNEISLI